MLWFIIFLVLVGLLVLGTKAYLDANDDFWPKQGVPFVTSSDTGSFLDKVTFKLGFHEMDHAAYKKIKSFGDKFKFGGIMELRRPVAFVTDLDLLRQIMVKDFDHFANRRPFGRKDDPSLVHKMLFAMEDLEWKTLRAAMTPTFTTGKIRHMFGVFNESSAKLENYLKTELRGAPKELDMKEILGRYTMDVIASAAFGVDSQNFKDKNSTFAQMGYKFQSHFTGLMGAIRNFTALLAPEVWKVLRFNFLDITAVEFFSSIVLNTMKHRESTGEKRGDFLQLMIEAKNGRLKAEDGDDTGSQITEKGQKLSKVAWSDELIVAQAVLFIFGGFDSVESMLVFAAYELALNQDIQSKLHEEIENAVEKHGELNYEVINQLEYLDMVISETLRKYPPSPRTERTCSKDYKIPDTDFEIKKGTSVIIPIWSIHHDPELYPDPERFIPERFSQEEKSQRHPYAYQPFGLGPRNCIANRFAITEGKATIAHLIHKFRLEPSNRTLIPMKFMTSSFALKPTDGMWLNVIARD